MIMNALDSQIFNNISLIFKQYGVDTTAKLIMTEDPIEEFKNYNPTRTDDTTNDLMSSVTGEVIPKTLILFSRTPPEKASSMLNNTPFEVYNTVNGSFISRKAFYGFLTYNVNILTDNSAVVDIIESLYEIEFYKRNKFTYIDFDLEDGGKFAENMPYRTIFDQLSDRGKVSYSSGNIVSFSFTFKVEGLFFLSFYEIHEGKLPVMLDIVSSNKEQTNIEMVQEKQIGEVIDIPLVKYPQPIMRKRNC